MRMINRLRRGAPRSLLPALILLVVPALPGCIAIPFPTVVEELPYDESELEIIEPGVTTRARAEELLGPPDVVRADGKIVLYGESRLTAGLIVGVAFGSGALVPVETLHLLALSYDRHDVVESVEPFRLGMQASDEELCTASDICITPRFVEGRGGSWMWDVRRAFMPRAIVYDTPANDTAAKAFPDPSPRCAVYVYHEEKLFSNRDLVIEQRDRPFAELMLDESAYLLWTRDPGPVSVAASLLPNLNNSGMYTENIPADGKPFVFDCRSGQRYFVRISVRGGFTTHSSVTLDDAAAGMEAVKQRRLILE